MAALFDASVGPGPGTFFLCHLTPFTDAVWQENYREEPEKLLFRRCGTNKFVAEQFERF